MLCRLPDVSAVSRSLRGPKLAACTRASALGELSQCSIGFKNQISLDSFWRKILQDTSHLDACSNGYDVPLSGAQLSRMLRKRLTSPIRLGLTSIKMITHDCAHLERCESRHQRWLSRH